VVVVESPPPPQRVVNETTFVPYENDSYARAHACAREQIARRYPRSVEYLEAEQALVMQYLSAQST